MTKQSSQAARRTETEASIAALGAHRVEFLGYKDSGMTGWEQNADSASFLQADLVEAAERLAVILREEDADVLTAYDWHGNSGHPDHIKVHDVGHAAADLLVAESHRCATVGSSDATRAGHASGGPSTSQPHHSAKMCAMPRVLTVVVTAMSLGLAACGGGSDDVAGPTTRLTLLPTTTTTEPADTTSTAPDEAADVTGVTGVTDVTAATVEPTSTTVPKSPTPTTTTEPTVTATTAPVDPAVDALVLNEDGIGAAVFSGDPDGVVAFISTFVGPPTADTGWVDPFDISACGGTELRVVSFGSLRLTFGDFSPVLEGRRHFFAYSYGDYTFDGSAVEGNTVAVVDQTPTGLVTGNGIGLGTDLLALEAAYPGLELNPADGFFPETFVVNDNFRGALTGLADDSTVVNIVGGQDCADPT